LLYDPTENSTALAISKDGEWRVESRYETPTGERLVPYRAENALIKHSVVLLPSEPEEYGTTAELLADIRTYIHRYADLPERFEILAAHYALFSWVHDRFAELPYLRLKGDFGTGKARFLLTVGSICRTPIFASGASSVSPLFHLLDRFGGTLILDEADFRFSGADADITKILNNGNVKGFPVLRSESKDGKEFSPRAFRVFGPKFVGMRGSFDDPALESRFLTESSGGRPLRRDVPLRYRRATPLPGTRPIAAMIHDIKPTAVVIENWAHASCRRSERVRVLLRDIAVQASKNGSAAMVYSRRHIRQAFGAAGKSKDTIAAAIATQLPALRPMLPPKPRIWESEHHSMAIFEAAAFALVHYGHRQTSKGTQAASSSTL
jgi:hypothetical protein